ncbi:MAG: TetR/AcrR family transcriptional regulator [Candidatus Binatia bacterium]|nr:TetR/AcrR family transcriptional regulator [Candidatus Binatia bacterium]
MRRKMEVVASVTEPSSREKILDAAELLFAQRGFAGVGMREVAEAVGLSKSSLFHHFRTKVELYAAVAARILAAFEERTAEIVAAPGDALERFDRWLDAMIDTLAERPTRARLLLRSLFEDDDLAGESEGEKEVDAIIHRLFASVGHLLREGMERGLFRVASIPHLLQSLIGLLVYHFASGEFGETLLRQSLFAPAAVEKRKQEVKALLYSGMLVGTATRKALRKL